MQARLLLAMAIGVAGILSEPRRERACRTGVCWSDVEIDEASEAVRLRGAMEASWRELNPS